MTNKQLTPVEVFNLIDSKRRRPWVGEEEVRIAWVSALEQGLGIHFDAERARKDSSYNNVIIEFKAPGFFGGSKSSAKFKEATEDRLLKYIQRASEQQGYNQADYIGIAIDGEHICFAQLTNGKLHTKHLLPFTPRTVGMVMDACQNSYRRTITAAHLIEDFGHQSPAATAFMQGLANVLVEYINKNDASKIKMLFEEWRTLYGQVADLSVDQAKSLDETLRFAWLGSNGDKVPAQLFAIHTYNSLLIKLLASEIVSSHGLSSRVHPAEEMATLLDDATLLLRLNEDIERGKLFSEAGISGFVEEAIFSWYLDVCKDVKHKQILIEALRDILGKLSLYLADRMEHTQDVLRDFYQDLVPETLRKSLGEFYTPDWLVEFTINKAHEGDWLSARVLDPTCGSGSFLIEVIRRKRITALEQNLAPKEIVKMLCATVWGFDLNPLAVQTARVNFLMEIADLLKDAPGLQIEVPVLLADAIYSPARDPKNDEDIVNYQIGSQIAGLDIALPAALAFDRMKLDAVFVNMSESVEDNQEYEKAENALTHRNIINETEAQAWHKPLKKTYDQILSLHRQNWNGIWFRIVRNFFWSATAGTFDIIIGNPPWVRWSKLPSAYRERVKPTCEQYDIFSKTPYHGGNELDISGMITYTTADKWLRMGGKLAFVITQSLFQNPSSSGFRNFKIKDNDWLRPLGVDDMKAIKPFPDAANKTAVVVFEKGEIAPTYPVSYRIWEAKQGQVRTINPSYALAEVFNKTTITKMEANPVGDIGSPWAILKPGRIADLRALTGASEWVEGRKGITADLNGVYFVPIIQNNNDKNSPLVNIQTRPEAGKTDIGAAKTVWVEPDALYPLIKGAGDFEACFFSPKKPLFAFVPNKGINKADYETSENMINTSLPRTKAYFEGFKTLLEKRSTWRTRMPNAPYFAVYNVGDFTFKPWKVIWAEMSGTFSAAVAGCGDVPLLGKRPYVPDHKVYFVPFEDKNEAYYLCGLLNSNDVREFIESHNVSIQTGDIFKHMHLPKYDMNNAKHTTLAQLVENAHSIANDQERKTFVAEVREAADLILDEWMKR